MPKISLTKGELKRQRDALKQYLRYLPTLQLKKQQLQTEIAHQAGIKKEKERQAQNRHVSLELWAGLLREADEFFFSWVKPSAVATRAKNIAGVDVRVFERAEFPEAEFDLFLTPAWYDGGLEALRSQAALLAEIGVIDDGIQKLRRELRVTAQRVNLFEKIKIPQAQDAIRRIKIYIGDQMANAVGRSKIAKKKIEEMDLVAV